MLKLYYFWGLPDENFAMNWRVKSISARIFLQKIQEPAISTYTRKMIVLIGTNKNMFLLELKKTTAGSPSYT